jgi:hypothetical protein
MACTYYPPANRPENHLAVRLRRTCPDRKFNIHNLAADGESADEFLRAERFDKAFSGLPCCLGLIADWEIAALRRHLYH